MSVITCSVSPKMTWLPVAFTTLQFHYIHPLTYIWYWRIKSPTTDLGTDSRGMSPPMSRDDWNIGTPFINDRAGVQLTHRAQNIPNQCPNQTYALALNTPSATSLAPSTLISTFVWLSLSSPSLFPSLHYPFSLLPLAAVRSWEGNWSY